MRVWPQRVVAKSNQVNEYDSLPSLTSLFKRSRLGHGNSLPGARFPPISAPDYSLSIYLGIISPVDLMWMSPVFLLTKMPVCHLKKEDNRSIQEWCVSYPRLDHKFLLILAASCKQQCHWILLHCWSDLWLCIWCCCQKGSIWCCTDSFTCSQTCRLSKRGILHTDNEIQLLNIKWGCRINLGQSGEFSRKMPLISLRCRTNQVLSFDNFQNASHFVCSLSRTRGWALFVSALSWNHDNKRHTRARMSTHALHASCSREWARKHQMERAGKKVWAGKVVCVGECEYERVCICRVFAVVTAGMMEWRRRVWLEEEPTEQVSLYFHHTQLRMCWNRTINTTNIHAHLCLPLKSLWLLHIYHLFLMSPIEKNMLTGLVLRRSNLQPQHQKWQYLH